MEPCRVFGRFPSSELLNSELPAPLQQRPSWVLLPALSSEAATAPLGEEMKRRQILFLT